MNIVSEYATERYINGEHEEMPVIVCNNISYTYPFQSKKALENISFTAGKGEIVLCTGASGCGKSTLLRVLNGLCPQFYKGQLEGELYIEGTSIVDVPLHQIAQRIGTVFQDPENQFFALTVQDELAFALEIQNVPSEEIRKRIEYVAEVFSLHNILTSTIHQISEGQKQKVALASIVVHKPNIIVLDEPTANLDPESTIELGKILKKLQKEGMTIFIVDHRIYWLQGIADTIYIMEEGRIAEKGNFTIVDDVIVQARYGLRAMQVEDTRMLLGNNASEEVFCAVKDIHFSYSKHAENIFTGLDISFYKGVTALCGTNGAGKTTLARLIAGLEAPQCGSIFIEGEAIPTKRLLEYVSIVLQNTDHQLCMKTVYQELCSACMSLPKALVHKRVEELLAHFALEHLSARHPQSLSGGEKQRLVLASGVAKYPKILIVDEPTSGLDGKNMKRIASMLEDIGSTGIALVITHDLELIDSVCTRVVHI